MNGGLGSTTIAANSSLGGTGTVSGNLANNGRLSPGYSPGTINVAGNYTQSATGTLVIQLASAASFDHLAVTGTAALAGGVQIDILGGYDVRGQSFTFLTADGGVSGKFSTQSGTAFATSMPTAAATVTYAANSVTFSIVQVPFAAFALTPNQTAQRHSAGQPDPGRAQRPLPAGLPGLVRLRLRGRDGPGRPAPPVRPHAHRLRRLLF